MKETVTEYESKVVEHEHDQYRSDLTDQLIADDDLIELHVNPQVETERSTIKIPLERNITETRWHDEIDSMEKRYAGHIESGDVLHCSVSEYAQLAEIDESDIDADSELPKAYVETAQPDVNALIDTSGLSDCLLFNCLYGAILLTLFVALPTPINTLVVLGILLLTNIGAAVTR